MLSRLSSFSGPFSSLFRIPGGFTTNGLILRYVIGDTDSYSGTNTVTDLQSNSNATLLNGPTFSVNGYLNFDGVNDYLMTDTSLNSKLSPANTSTVISHFCWIYPQDNGVIITEQGVSSPLNFNWHDSQIEVVSGALKFSVWQGITINSSIAISLHNWYYVGLTYDGLNLKAYVNGQLAGSTTGSRLTPYNNGSGVGLYYGIAAEDFTDLGDGTYAKMKLGDFHVYNIALSQQQVLNNYNATKNNYIYTEDMLVWIDANDPSSFSGGSISDLSGNGYTHSLTGTSSTIYGVKYFDCNISGNYLRVNGTGPTLSTSGYTYVAWARIKSDSSTYRTLYRTSPNDHPILVDINTDNLGFWDNDTTSFKDSGYDVTQIEDKWVQYSVVGDSSSSIFYINDAQVGSVSFGAGGNKHDYFGGLSGQPFGYVGNMILYNTKLTQAQIRQNFLALTHVYPNIEIFTTVGSTTWTAPYGVTTVEYLVVAGGGGGGNGYDSGGGGGGAGGMVLTGIVNVTPGSSYTVTVGQGGAGGADTRTNNNGVSGGNSVFDTITALGGIYGGGSRTNNPGPAGFGAGLGGATQSGSISAPTGGNGGGGGNAGGGGGGASTKGTNRTSSSVPGVGGSGITSTISGSSVIYGAGGNGGSANAGTINGTNGASNTGKGGGAGSANFSDSSSGGNGGSGIVIIKYY